MRTAVAAAVVSSAQAFPKKRIEALPGGGRALWLAEHDLVGRVLESVETRRRRFQPLHQARGGCVVNLGGERGGLAGVLRRRGRAPGLVFCAVPREAPHSPTGDALALRFVAF